MKEVGDAVAFMKARITKIFLIGHSLSTPIVGEYYQGDNPDPAVAAIAELWTHIDIRRLPEDRYLV